MLDHAALADFLLVAAHGGIAEASRASGRPRASLSRRVMELEASLGVRLFERGARSLRLTEAGALLHARTAGPMHEIADAGEAVRDGSARPQGRLRLNVPVLFGHLAMGRLAAGFARACPSVELDITVTDRRVDPATEGFDVVVRVDPKPDTDLVGRCFLHDETLIVAAPSLPFPDECSPERPIPCVRLSTHPAAPSWRLPASAGGRRDVPLRPVLTLPSLFMVRDAVLTGTGAARLPRLLVDEDLRSGRLLCWAPADARPVEIWALHVSRRLPSAKVRAFMRFLDDVALEHERSAAGGSGPPLSSGTGI